MAATHDGCSATSTTDTVGAEDEDEEEEEEEESWSSSDSRVLNLEGPFPDLGASTMTTCGKSAATKSALIR